MAVRVDLTLPAKLVCAAGEPLALMALGGFLVAGATEFEEADCARAAARFLRCAASLVVATVFAAGFFVATFLVAVFVAAVLLVATFFAVAVTLVGAGSAAGAGFAERFSDCLTLPSALRVERRWDRASILRVLEVGFPLAAAAGAVGADAIAPWNAPKAFLNA